MTLRTLAVTGAVTGALLWAVGCSDHAVGVAPVAETAAVANEGDAADDIAIWLHPTDPGASVIIGTDKRGGLSVYDLQGREIQSLPEGPTNNVDLRNDFPLDGELISLVAATHTRDAQIGFYRVDVDSRRLEPVARVGVDDFRPVGICMYHSPVNGKFYVLGTDRHSHLRQWEIVPVGRDIELHTVRRLTFASHIEACATDDDSGRLYVSEEDEGIWCLDAEPDSKAPAVMVDEVGHGRVEPDIEGLALVPSRGEGLLVASSQKSDTFAVYRSAPPFAYVGKLRVVAGNGIDEVTHTDGLDINVSAMGVDFPGGLLVVQDDENDGANQNFKLVRWEQVLHHLDESGTLRGPKLAASSAGESHGELVER